MSVVDDAGALRATRFEAVAPVLSVLDLPAALAGYRVTHVVDPSGVCLHFAQPLARAGGG